jgi:hypothetical protein
LPLWSSAKLLSGPRKIALFLLHFFTASARPCV